MDTYISITTSGNTCNSIASNTHQTSQRTNKKKKNIINITKDICNPKNNMNFEKEFGLHTPFKICKASSSTLHTLLLDLSSRNMHKKTTNNSSGI